MERITRYSRDELTMMNLALLLTEDSRSALDEMNTRQMAGECTEPCAVAIQAKCVAVRWFPPPEPKISQPIESKSATTNIPRRPPGTGVELSAPHQTKSSIYLSHD